MIEKQVWLYASYSWSEIGLSGEDRTDFFKKMSIQAQKELVDARKAVFWDVCGAFAVFTALTLLTVGTMLPDWGFDEKYVVDKVSHWQRQPLWHSLINPLWWLGYPVACLIVFADWRKLSKWMEQASHSS